MKSDTLFNKRKRSKLALRAKQPLLSIKRYLIVCEGEKTEVNYFNSLINEWKLNRNVTVETITRNDPLGIVNYAITELRNTEKNWNSVICVFDKDQHENYNEAIRKAQKNKRIIIANSVPCFEYWLILHYESYNAPFYSNPSKSPCSEALTILHNHIKEYEKNQKDIWNLTKNKLSDAIYRANLINIQSANVNTDNPSTYVGVAINLLMKLKEEIIRATQI